MHREYRDEKAGRLKHPQSYIRKNMGTEEELRALGRSYIRRPIHALIVRPTLEVADGNRRLDGILLEGGPETIVPICVTDEVIDEATLVEIQMETATHTRSISAFERYVGIRRLLELRPGETGEVLAHKLGISPTGLCRILSLSRCIEPVVQAAAQDQISASDWYAISKANSPAEQLVLLEMKLNGGCTRDELEKTARKRRKAENSNGQPDERARRVCLYLPGATSLTLSSAEGASLTMIIDALTCALAEAKAVERKDGGVKTLITSLQERNRPKEAATK